MYRRAMAPASI